MSWNKKKIDCHESNIFSTKFIILRSATFSQEKGKTLSQSLTYSASYEG